MAEDELPASFVPDAPELPASFIPDELPASFVPDATEPGLGQKILAMLGPLIQPIPGAQKFKETLQEKAG